MKPLHLVIACCASVFGLAPLKAQLNSLQLEGPIFFHNSITDPDRTLWFPDGNGVGEEFRFVVVYDRGLIPAPGSTSAHATYLPPPGKSVWSLQFGSVEIGGAVSKFEVFNGAIDGFTIEYMGADSLTLLSIQLFLNGSELPNTGMPGVTQLPNAEPTAPNFTTGILRFDHGDEFLPLAVGQMFATVRGGTWELLSGPISPVPEPSIYSLAGVALAAAILFGRNRWRRSADVT